LLFPRSPKTHLNKSICMHELFYICLLNKIKKPTLPEWKENNGFDGKEFQNRVEWSQHFLCGEIKQKQSIQSQTDRHVIDHSDVQVASTWANRIEKLLIVTCTYWPKFDYLQSPSWYSPMDCRIIVNIAITGFTRQNWSVACLQNLRKPIE
jgi:hypothetical protein